MKIQLKVPSPRVDAESIGMHNSKLLHNGPDLGTYYLGRYSQLLTSSHRNIFRQLVRDLAGASGTGGTTGSNIYIPGA